MKTFYLIGLLLFLNQQFYGETITGKVVSASNNKPLIYVSIGVVETPFGTITNEEGIFSFEVNGQSNKTLVRFSMIGFKSQTYSIEELSGKENLLRMESETYRLSEVIVKPAGKLRKLGTTGYSYRKGFCGWASDGYGKGHEVGTEIDLGESPMRLRSLNIRVNKQSYDSSLFRLHIRSIVDGLPHNELLNTDILIPITKETGWVEINLSKYNLVFEGEIALSLEWIKVIGLDMNKFISVNGTKQPIPAVTFNIKRDKGCLFSKWGSEAKWKRFDDQSPSFYLTAQ